MSNCITQYYCCRESDIRVAWRAPFSRRDGFFQFGKDITCYGDYTDGGPTIAHAGKLHDIEHCVEIDNGTVYLPFDASLVADNLRREIYVEDHKGRTSSALAEIYYCLRPILPVLIRRRLQRMYLNGWKAIPFPLWPVDITVDKLMERLLLLAIRAGGLERVPFVWFWPDGAQACAVVTHDVETATGRDFCGTLMDVDDSFGIKASFQLIPEERYHVDEKFLSQIRDRGFEVVVHDLNHDGRLYKSRMQFLERAARINSYGREFKAKGFRAGILYRKQIWYDALDFEYDMSVPNAAHLDPQRGGCCTVMPYFIGNILELPVTTTQDYTLFNILNNYSTSLWEQQIQIILENHGFMNFIVHPDYVTKKRERQVFEALLDRLAGLRQRERVWTPTPGEVNRWWRQRTQMVLVEDAEGWRIEGEGSERAVLAYASEEGGKLAVRFANHGQKGRREFSDTRQHS